MLAKVIPARADPREAARPLAGALAAGAGRRPGHQPRPAGRHPARTRTSWPATSTRTSSRGRGDGRPGDERLPLSASAAAAPPSPWRRAGEPRRVPARDAGRMAQLRLPAAAVRPSAAARRSNCRGEPEGVRRVDGARRGRRSARMRSSSRSTACARRYAVAGDGDAVEVDRPGRARCLRRAAVHRPGRGAREGQPAGADARHVVSVAVRRGEQVEAGQPCSCSRR